MHLIETDLDDLLAFAQAWTDLGSTVQEQVRDLIEGTDDDLNFNAIQAAHQKLASFHERLGDELKLWLDEHDDD